ncbi:MAG: acyl-CoA dehydratase activase-related protein [Acidaminococcales bacterium]|nr:acyl-CoA dehydratase activase-related protein [Acidaminococcales bacterium]
MRENPGAPAEEMFRTGLDVGSTTVKLAVIDKNDKLIFQLYRRHLSDVRQTLDGLFQEAAAKFGERRTTLAIAGSGGMALAEPLGGAFIQEVVAGAEAIRHYLPDTDVAIELGGEDAKLTFFDAGVDQRMNETCAGGTGAFIDQMASFLSTDPSGLDALAARHRAIYPIAARCGVFAKNDILPLLNEGAAKEDIAVSILQAVVDQTIGGLACGRAIRGRVVFLGGPLYFLPQLRERFIKTLKLSPGDFICPKEAPYFVALGAALYSKKNCPETFSGLAARSARLAAAGGQPEMRPLPPLFENIEDLRIFQQRHALATLPKVGWPADGKVFIGFDAGSTTTKAVVIDEDGGLVHFSYGSNLGSPLQSVMNALSEIYRLMPRAVTVAKAGVTGYGEGLVKAALNIDVGEVETVAHYKAAAFFAPDVSFIIDIGGQDIKCLSVKNGLIDRLMLNEACSSGCGSFLETFAKTLSLDAPGFAKAALFAAQPMDLGSRCTVFMNSKVKQAQKEGASVGDISAGLSYSVVRNALYKVIRIANAEELGDKVVVQGGAFLNDAVLRAFELSINRHVVRPDISGLMGAFGAALLAREEYRVSPQPSVMIGKDALLSFSVKVKSSRCHRCANRCLLTINSFPDGRRYISGNRCERGSGGEETQNPLSALADKSSIASHLAKLPVIGGLAGQSPKPPPTLPNLYKWKYERLFDFYKQSETEKTRGRVGLPRVLSFYELYPFWFTFFDALGLKVELSPPSSKEMLSRALDTIPSQTVCYPAKLAHGHITELARKKIDFIFYPCLPFSPPADYRTDGSYNCPLVTSYAEVLRLNIDLLRECGVKFVAPFLDLGNHGHVAETLRKELGFLPLLAAREVEAALKKAYGAQHKFWDDVRQAGERALDYLANSGRTGVVLAGHPYHLDPQAHHGIPDIITANGLAVLTEDSIAHKGGADMSLRVVDQWVYHSRLYKSADYVAKCDNLEIVNLVSFGCGIDAVCSDQVAEIIEAAGKVYTAIKIDEGDNLGAARIRIRSLLAAVKERRRTARKNSRPETYKYTPAALTSRKDLSRYTLLAPQMSPAHWQFMEPVMATAGYQVKVLPEVSREAVETGLRYVNNDACYPAIVSIGQVIHALQSGQHDLGRTAVLMSQTGGGCRASNYVAFLRRALLLSGLERIPVIPVGMVAKKNEMALRLTPWLLNKLTYGLLYGDMLQRLLLASRPYENDGGSAQKLYGLWAKKAEKSILMADRKIFAQDMRSMVEDFAALGLRPPSKPKVGIVGEILINFHPDANNRVVSLVEAEGGEACLPELSDFVLYCLYDHVFQADELGYGKIKKWICEYLSAFIEKRRDSMRDALSGYPRFGQIKKFAGLVNIGKKILSLGNQSGEGWCLAADMAAMLESGVSGVLCLQPFGCLPNHITGKGVIKELKRLYPGANLAALDYDAGTSEVNQLNRIKLLMSSVS